MASSDLIPLALMNTGQSGVLAEIRGLRHHDEACAGPRFARHRRGRRGHINATTTAGRPHLEHRLNCLGLVPGERVTVVQNSFSGPLIIAIKGSRLGLVRGIAIHLMVIPDGDDGDGQQ
jgi:Fe2+ transport system protein FeoA